MLSDHWPLVGLHLRTGRVELRVPDEDELAAIADLAAAGVHPPGARPFLTPWTDLPPAGRALHVVQQHWGRRGSWRVEDWVLELGIFVRSSPVGMVALRARDFPVLREVTTESWLGVAHHRQGLGTEARTALLHLAFHGLDALSATSEVFQDNVASQTVSRRLGYRSDGVSRDVLHGRPVLSDRLRLDREDWLQAARPAVAVSGLGPCLVHFQGR